MSLNDEILYIRSLMEKNVDKDIQPLLRAYKRSLNSVRTEIAKIYAEYMVDGELKISKRQRYTVSKQLEKLLIEQARELGHIDVEHTTKILTDVYEESFYRTAYVIDKGIESIISFSLLHPEFVKSAVMTPIEGKMFSDRIWRNKELLVNSLRDKIEKAMIEGKDVRKLSREIQKDFEVSAYVSKRLLSNELARCVGQAQDEIYKQSGVVQEVLFDATLDSKTSNICRRLDGKTFPLDDHPKIPSNTHVGCRSCLIPVVDGWKPTRKRENIKDQEGNKNVIDYSSYEEWKKSRNID